MTEVSIILPTLNEEDVIQSCLESIENQCVIQSDPNNYEIIVADSSSTDMTKEIADNTLFGSILDYKIIDVPKGKLTARNIATEQAKGDIIVSVDADCIYPEHWLYYLLKPLRDNEVDNGIDNGIDNESISNADFVVATKGKTLNGTENIFNNWWTFLDDLDSLVLQRNRMVGRNSAYYKWAFYEVGQFNTNPDEVNQQDAVSIFNEEEIGFGDRLSKLGKVVYIKKAVCYHMHIGTDKTFCRFPIIREAMKTECAGVGTERF